MKRDGACEQAAQAVAAEASGSEFLLLHCCACTLAHLARDVEHHEAGMRLVVVGGVQVLEALLARSVPDVCRGGPQKL
jgi:hypothetical protein